MIVFNNKEHGQAIADKIPRRFNPACDPVISNVDADGKLLGGVTYDGYTNACIFIHQASFSRLWLSRTMLYFAFDYPFNQLGCSKVCGTIPSSDSGLLAFNLRLGFIEETRIKDAYPDGDMIILSMTRNQCPWLRPKPRGIRAGGEQ